MKKTAIEELIERETDCFCEQGYYFEYLKPNLVKAIISELQAKHDEELKQAVIEAYNIEIYDGEDDYGINAEQYYEANFNTKEL